MSIPRGNEICYADDTTIFVSDEDFEDLFTKTEEKCIVYFRLFKCKQTLH